MCSLLNIRNRFEEFASIRSNVKTLRNQEGLACVKAQSPSPAEEPKQTWNPPWLRALEGFSALEKIVKDKMDTLVERQKSFFCPNFLSEEDETLLQNIIDTSALEVRKLLKELERFAICDVNLHCTYNSDELIIHSNVKRYLCSHLNHLVQDFKNAQEFYINKLRLRWHKKQRYMKFGSDEGHELVCQEEKSIPFFKMGYSEASIQELMKEYKKSEKIDEEVKHILNTLKEIHELFEDLNKLTTKQSEILDRIDYSIKCASTHTLNGKESLKKAQESQAGNYCAII
ncbi:unnamed protein product [Phytomonas sp. Hart1]|nr:unnamed protein product [Phytomonas sp. Hart1]|eukprot:CCW66229.1 unnamed protein product [Phytomonas sp. isolate Hart1]